MGRILVVLATSLAVVMAGCNVTTAPTTVSRLGDHGATAGKTTYSGEYLLYKLPDHSRDPLESGTFVTTVRLDKGQWIGFKSAEPGSVVAVAGDQQIPVQAGKYEWVMKADAGQNDPAATTLYVIVVVVVVVAVVAIGLYVYTLSQVGPGFQGG